MNNLQARQEQLVASLVAGAPDPPGFAPAALAAVRAALLRKRAEDVARVWPRLARSYGTGWTAEFASWAAGRPPRGSLRDGWDFAHAHVLAGAAAQELAAAKATFVLRRDVLKRRRWRV